MLGPGRSLKRRSDRRDVDDRGHRLGVHLLDRRGKDQIDPGVSTAVGVAGEISGIAPEVLSCRKLQRVDED